MFKIDKTFRYMSIQCSAKYHNVMITKITIMGNDCNRDRNYYIYLRLLNE